ncbi:methyltransferase domain-containing protein [Pedococcus sp. KACC 23699]|uniref:Methyltransferase domain-containing protein n=1 Tax=Pedococcus sp. KACC 23699 TaxID=3149228 RepID=A0AAU7JPG1_9MICO
MVDASRYDSWRRQLVGDLRGTVLELGAGRGENLPHLPDGVRWLALEPNRGRARQLQRTTCRLRAVGVLRAGAEQLPLEDGSVDAVVTTFALCSVRRPGAAVAEVRRVVRPGGRLVFLEHVGAPEGTAIRRLQAAVAPCNRLLDHGCDPTRDTEELLRSAGFAGLEVERFVVTGPLGLRIDHIAGSAVVQV